MPKPYILDLTAAGEADINKLIGNGFTSTEQVAEIPVYISFNKDKNDTGLKKDHIAHIAKALHKELKVPANKKVIFVYPANSVTAKVKPSARHNQNSSGLAEVFEMPGIDNAGISTITQPGGTELASQEEIKHYIAQIYALAAQGHVLVLPKDKKRYAFGGGVSQNFVDSAQDKLLQQELKKLEDFLNNIEGKQESETNALIAQLDAPYAEAYQRGLLNKDKNPDDVFLSFGQKPAVNTGNAETFKFKDLQKIQTLCSTLNITMTKESEVKYKLKDNKNNEMIVEPHRVSAAKDENDVDFYLNMIKIAAANVSAGKQLHFFAPDKEKEKIQQAIDQAAKLSPPIKVDLVTDAGKFKQIEDEAKQELSGAPATPSSPPPPPVIDPLKDNLLLKVLTSNVNGYTVEKDKAGFKITTPQDSTDIVNAFKALGLAQNTHYDPPAAKDSHHKSYVKLKAEAIAVLKSKYESTNPKSALLEKSIAKLEAPMNNIADIKNILEHDPYKENILVEALLSGRSERNVSDASNTDKQFFTAENNHLYDITNAAELNIRISAHNANEDIMKNNVALGITKLHEAIKQLGLTENTDFVMNNKDTWATLTLKPEGLAKLKGKESPAIKRALKQIDLAMVFKNKDAHLETELLRQVINGNHEIFGIHKRNDNSYEVYLKVSDYMYAYALDDGYLESIAELINTRLAKTPTNKIERNGKMSEKLSHDSNAQAITITQADLDQLQSTLSPRKTL